MRGNLALIRKRKGPRASSLLGVKSTTEWSPLSTEYSSIVFFSSFELSTRRDWCAASKWDSGGVTAVGRGLSSFSLTDSCSSSYSFLLFFTLSARAHQPSSMGLPSKLDANLAIPVIRLWISHPLLQLIFSHVRCLKDQISLHGLLSGLGWRLLPPITGIPLHLSSLKSEPNFAHPLPRWSDCCTRSPPARKFQTS